MKFYRATRTFHPEDGHGTPSSWSVIVSNEGDVWKEDYDKVEFGELSDIQPVPLKWNSCAEWLPPENIHICLKIHHPRWEGNNLLEFEYVSAVFRNNTFYYFDFEDQNLFSQVPSKYDLFWATWDAH